MIVLDASAVLELILGTSAGRSVRAWIARPRETLHAPHLLDLEVVHALRRYERLDTVDRSRVAGALHIFRDLTLHRYSHELLLPRIWELRQNLSAYDAAYVALAEALEAPLLTTDRRLGAAPAHRARVEVI